MALRLTKATCFAQGAWNIYILQPEWLARKGVFTSDRPVRVETLATGPGIRLTAGRKHPRWVATPFQVQTEVEKPAPGEDVGSPLARLVEALPDTPLKSVGFQFVYQSQAGKDMQVLSFLPAAVRESEPVIRYGASMLVQQGGTDYFFDLSQSSSGEPARLFVMCEWVSDDARQAAGRLRAYQECEQAAREIAGRYWQVTFS